MIGHACLPFMPAHITFYARALLAAVTGKANVVPVTAIAVVNLSVITARSDTPPELGDPVGGCPEKQSVEPV